MNDQNPIKYSKEMRYILSSFRNEVRTVLEKANYLYGRPFNWVNGIDIHFEKLDDAAAQVWCLDKHIIMVFDPRLILCDYEGMKNIIIPHEVAHVVGFKFSETGIIGHNQKWREVDLMLGGNGAECYRQLTT